MINKEHHQEEELKECQNQLQLLQEPQVQPQQTTSSNPGLQNPYIEQVCELVSPNQIRIFPVDHNKYLRFTTRFKQKLTIQIADSQENISLHKVSTSKVFLDVFNNEIEIGNPNQDVDSLKEGDLIIVMARVLKEGRVEGTVKKMSQKVRDNFIELMALLKERKASTGNLLNK